MQIILPSDIVALLQDIPVPERKDWCIEALRKTLQEKAPIQQGLFPVETQCVASCDNVETQ